MTITTGSVDIEDSHRSIEASWVIYEAVESFSELYNREVENLPLLF